MSNFAVIGLALWCQSPHAQGIPTPSPAPKEQADKPTEKSAPNPSGISVTIIETLEQAKAGEAREKESHDHDAKDLDAQIRAADAAEKQIGPAWVAAILSFVGTCLILWTLLLTRQANTIARDTAKRQLRAYLIANGGAIERIPEGYILSVVIRNSGQTPAFDVKHSSESFCGDYPDDGPSEIPRVNDTHYTVVGAGDSFSCAQRLFTETPDQSMRDVIDGKIGFWIHGIVQYRDCFDNTHTTRFRYVFGGRIAKTGGLVFHSDKHGNEAD